MPMGRSRCGFLASWAVVETASNPIYAKICRPLRRRCRRTRTAQTSPSRVPSWPCSRNAIPITNNTTATLMTTMVELKRALSNPDDQDGGDQQSDAERREVEADFDAEHRGRVQQLVARCASSGDFAAAIAPTLSRNADVPGTRLGSEACAICRATMFSAVRNPVQWS